MSVSLCLLIASIQALFYFCVIIISSYMMLQVNSTLLWSEGGRQGRKGKKGRLVFVTISRTDIRN